MFERNLILRKKIYISLNRVQSSLLLIYFRISEHLFWQKTRNVSVFQFPFLSVNAAAV